MKFAKYLQDEVVPEWRKAYINYKQCKKFLKAIERALDQLDAEAAASENSLIPAHLLGTSDLEGRVIAPELSPPLQYGYQGQKPPLSTSPPAAHPQTAVTSASPNTNSATPILSRNRGHARNYSTIIIPPPTVPDSPNISFPDSAYPRGSTAIEDDRPGLGEATLCESNDGAVSATERVPGDPVKSDSNVSQFSQTARSQSSHILKSISRRFTIINPPQAPLRTRTIQGRSSTVTVVLFFFCLV
ncbi:SPX domain-containing protein [Dissophora ornata]|nr:SPX domain-containing protein [Dissophora ornata]